MKKHSKITSIKLASWPIGKFEGKPGTILSEEDKETHSSRMIEMLAKNKSKKCIYVLCIVLNRLIHC